MLALVLWVLVCLPVIRAKKQSTAWLVLAALGPLGLAILAVLNDRETTSDGATEAADRYSLFVRNLRWYVRAVYELLTFAILWELAYQGIVLKRALMVRFEAVRTGMSVRAGHRSPQRFGRHVGLCRGHGSDVFCGSSLPASPCRL